MVSADAPQWHWGLGTVRLDATNLAAFARGCAVLGAGGGGSTDAGLLMALHAVEEYGPVDVVDADALEPAALVMPCGLVGSPAVASERLWSGEEGVILRSAVEGLHGADVAGLMCFEIAGANGLLPIAWAARAGLPVVDADGMGRAFPALSQQAMALAGITASPVVLADGRGNCLTLHAADDRWAERLAHQASMALGGVCAGALYVLPAGAVATAAIAGSISRAIDVGRAVGLSGARARIAETADALGGTMLVEGRVLQVHHEGDGAGRWGSATLQGLGGEARRQLRLELQSEFLVALEDGAVRSAVPDLIALFGSNTGDPVVVEAVRPGQRVAVLVASGPAVWKTRRGLARAGPRAFGYDLAHTPR
jgi:uncharacterized protein